MSDIKIHPDFASMERQLSDEELRHLEQAVMSVGEVVNPLIIWKETGFLIDGHHRYELARAKGIKYTTREISFQRLPWPAPAPGRGPGQVRRGLERHPGVRAAPRRERGERVRQPARGH